jgi:hypothetical protein
MAVNSSRVNKKGSILDKRGKVGAIRPEHRVETEEVNGLMALSGVL